ncbi:MAG: hypothetical protein PVG19_07145 [Desulfobacterales bacterium]|jgi:hypothetical protein
MRFMPILPKPGIRGQTRAAGALPEPLPTFYMNDYSVMGLRVSDCAATFKLLEDHRYAVTDRQGSRGVTIGSARDVRQIIELLSKNGVSGEMADIAEQIYQG